MPTRIFPLLLFLTPAAWCLPAPALTYSTFLRTGFTPAAIATDGVGNVYVAGSILLDPASFQGAPMVVKLNPQGTQYIYVRVLGGSASDLAAALAVDSSGNAYLVGTTSSPDFPMVAGGPVGSPATSPNDRRAFLVKLNPQGEILFSEMLGTVGSTGQAVAIDAQGEIVVSGLSTTKGFPATTGAYSIADTTGRPFLMKLSADGSRILFTATGIGGSSLAFDASGNIYMAGSTQLTDYPTTPGSYQPTLKPVSGCIGLCLFFSLPGTNQYVTKVDPAGTKLLYSTGVAGTAETVNGGLAVDAQGNAYVTGLTYGTYPYSVAAPAAPQARPILTKLDSAGANALFSIPAGGTGIALSGNVAYVGGDYNDVYLGVYMALPASLPAGVASLPSACQANNITTIHQAYVAMVDMSSGQVLPSTVLVDGSSVSPRGIALGSGSTVWLAGSALQADTPITRGALTPARITPGPLTGAYLGSADFSVQPVAAAPQLICVTDAANLSRLGPVAPNQIVALMGTGLGPDQGAIAAARQFSLAGVTVTFDGEAGQLLYASSSQINVAVPWDVGGKSFTTMQITVNGATAPPRVLPVAARIPNLFVNLTTAQQTCQTPDGPAGVNGILVVAANQDGTANSCSNPAKAGSVVTFFLNGVGGQSTGNGTTIPLLPFQVPVSMNIGSWSAEVVNVVAQNDWVWRVDARIPAAVPSGLASVSVDMSLNFYTGDVVVGPVSVSTTGTPVPMSVWVTP